MAIRPLISAQKARMTPISIPQLRPLNIGQLLDLAVSLYRQNFLTFMGIIAIVQIPLILVTIITFGGFFSWIQEIDSVSGPSSSQFLVGGTVSIIVILSYVLAQGLMTAAMTQAISSSYLGEKLSILAAYRLIGRSWLSLLGAFVLLILIALGLVIWWIIPCVGWFTGLGGLTFVFMVILPLVAPIIVLEKQRAGAAIRRAWDLSRRRFWGVFGFVLVLYLFNFFIIIGPTSVLSVISEFLLGESLNTSTSLVILQTVQSLVELMASLIYLPLQLAAITLMYFDLRIRTEGLDLEILSSTEQPSPSSFAKILAQAPSPERGNLVTAKEVGFFFLIQLILIGLYLIVIFFAIVIFMFVSGSAGF